MEKLSLPGPPYDGEEGSPGCAGIMVGLLITVGFVAGFVLFLVIIGR